MTIQIPVRLFALGGASLALFAAPLSASIPPPPSAVELAQQGDDLAWSITEDLTTLANRILLPTGLLSNS